MYSITAFRLIIFLILSSALQDRFSMGFPIVRQSRTDQDDIIAGKDFLSVVLSSLKHQKPETRSTSSTGVDDLMVDNSEQYKTIVRDSRSSLYTLNTTYDNPESELVFNSDSVTISVPLSFPADYYSTEPSISNDPSLNQEAINNFLHNEFKEIDTRTDDYKSNEQIPESSSTIVSAIVSIPIDDKKDSKKWRDIDIFDNHTVENSTKDTETETIKKDNIDEEIKNDENTFEDKQITSLNFESRHNHFGVEESEPITNSAHSRYQPSSHHDTSHSPVPFGANPDYIEQQREREERKKQELLHPYHQTVIYHGPPREGSRARSVSYNSMIQNVHQNQPEPRWETAETIERPGYIINSPHVDTKTTEKETDAISQTDSKNTQKPVQKSTEDDLFGDFLSTHQNRNKNVPKTTDSLTSSSQTITTTVKSSTDYNYEYQYQEQNWEESEKVYGHSEQVTKAISSTASALDEERGWSVPEKNYEVPEKNYEQSSTQKQNNFRVPTTYGVPELNYEVDEAVSVMTNGRAHGVQPVSVPKDNDNHKVGYVVEGRNFRKYRVEERTSDGFIVGEYGVVSHDDGSLRGVRYAADGTINPRLIYDALMKFLSL